MGLGCRWISMKPRARSTDTPVVVPAAVPRCFTFPAASRRSRLRSSPTARTLASPKPCCLQLPGNGRGVNSARQCGSASPRVALVRLQRGDQALQLLGVLDVELETAGHHDV